MDFAEYMAMMQLIQSIQDEKKRQQQAANQQQQGGGGISPMQGYRMYSKFAGSGGGTAGGTAGETISPSYLSAITDKLYGPAGAVGAIIAGQHLLSNQTSNDRKFEGVTTDDIFSTKEPHFGTEPWAAFVFDKLGIEAPTSGEKFDAATQNKDWLKALRRAPAAASHYLDPSTALSYDLLQNKKFGSVGKAASKLLFPWRWAMDLFD